MSLKQVEGVVVRTSEKVVNTQSGQATTYSALINEGTGESWYGFKFKNPNLSQNQQIKFSAASRNWTNAEGIEQTYWDGDSTTIETVKTAAAAAPAVMKRAVKNVDNRQRSIVLQTAFKVAPSMIAFAITNNFVTLPTKKADKFDAYKALVTETALELAAKFIDPPTEFVQEVDESVTDVTSEYTEACGGQPVV